MSHQVRAIIKPHGHRQSVFDCQFTRAHSSLLMQQLQRETVGGFHADLTFAGCLLYKDGKMPQVFTEAAIHY